MNHLNCTITDLLIHEIVIRENFSAKIYAKKVRFNLT